MRGRPAAGLPETLEAMRAVFCEGDGTMLGLLKRPLLVGERLGGLPEGLAKLPLQEDIERQQKSLRLKPAASVTPLELDLREPGGRARSVFLHRLRALRIQWGKPVDARGGKGASKKAEPKAEAKAETKPTSLLLENPVRSGQTVIFPEGDVTILGSVGSGAEVVAGGSIHVYGALRGRAMAGVNGHTSARIYCQKIEAELLAIDGFYQTADDIDAALRGKPAQAWLEGNTMRITALN